MLISFLTGFFNSAYLFATSRVFSLLNSLSKMDYIISFSLGYSVWSYSDLHRLIIDTVPSASPIAAIEPITEMEVKGESDTF
jgi:hypothetical protein